MTTAEEFFLEFSAKLRAKAATLAAYGAVEPSKTCEAIAADLESDFRGWWLAELSIADAARESGYSEGRLREMARDGELTHKKGAGVRGHFTIARCDLPRRPKPKPSIITSLEERLLGPRTTGLQKPA
jgi:hypothetical protein